MTELEAVFQEKWETLDCIYGGTDIQAKESMLVILNARNEEIAQHVVDIHNNSLEPKNA